MYQIMTTGTTFVTVYQEANFSVQKKKYFVKFKNHLETLNFIRSQLLISHETSERLYDSSGLWPVIFYDCRRLSWAKINVTWVILEILK